MAIDITDATFQKEVIERSMITPVVIDLWAQWCGPCKTLGPILEKLTAATNGEVILAKVDVDSCPQVAQAFQVQSIPAVYAMKDGKIVDGFVGAQSQPIQMGQLAVFGEGDEIVVKAAQHQESRSPNLELFILGGAPIKEPVAWMGPFVMNTKREVLQAFEDFQKGLLGSIPAIYKEDAKPKAPLNRTDKLQGDSAGASSDDSAAVLDVHGAPTDMQESTER